MNKPQAWPQCDEDIKIYIESLLERVSAKLGERLIGIYLHGSLAMGSYYRPKSDIDIIVVVAKPLPAKLAQDLGKAIALAAEDRPTTGNVELSVVTAESAKNMPIPMPFEVHYSSGWHDKILCDEVDYTRKRTDPDLASHLMYVTQRGVCLYGMPISEVFGQVEWPHFLDAVMDDLNWILEDEHIVETPYYSILNICRVFQLLSENNQRVHSKDEGGEWGLKHLPAQFRSLIQQALDIYRSPEIVTEEQRKTGDKSWNSADLLAFRDYARQLKQQWIDRTPSRID